MKGEVDGGSSTASKRKRPFLDQCEGSSQVNSRPDLNIEYDSSGLFSQPKVRYRRTTRADKLAMGDFANVGFGGGTNVSQFSDSKGADILARSEVPNFVLEDVTNVIPLSELKEQLYPLSGKMPSVRVSSGGQHDENYYTHDNLAFNRAQQDELYINQRLGGGPQHLKCLGIKHDKSEIMSYIERSRVRAEVVLSTIGAASDVIHGAQTLAKTVGGPKRGCDMSGDNLCMSSSVGPVGNEKKLSYRGVKKIMRDLSHQFTAVHAPEVNLEEEVVDLKDVKPESMSVYDHCQPLRRSKRFRLLSELMNAGPGNVRVKSSVNDASTSDKAQPSNEITDPLQLGSVENHDVINPYYDSDNDEDRTEGASAYDIKFGKIIYTFDCRKHCFAVNLQPQEIQNLALVEIERIIRKNGRSLSEWTSMPQPQVTTFDSMNNPLIAEQLNFNREEQFNEYQRLWSLMTEEQESVFAAITSAIDSGEGIVIFNTL
ncbi:hypothetical protein RIF29_15174 [Crotalaria pallida]|uniref:Uncharacterized protein n=1 Tax=Crotalaria pallida TaxID=3830 RepID=A0AAN9FEH2_CROPI